jgi:hypothetical protein
MCCCTRGICQGQWLDDQLFSKQILRAIDSYLTCHNTLMNSPENPRGHECRAEGKRGQVRKLHDYQMSLLSQTTLRRLQIGALPVNLACVIRSRYQHARAPILFSFSVCLWLHSASSTTSSNVERQLIRHRSSLDNTTTLLFLPDTEISNFKPNQSNMAESTSSPVFDAQKVTVIYVLGGPGAGKFPLRNQPPRICWSDKCHRERHAM